jgi:hypothetical protein
MYLNAIQTGLSYLDMIQRRRLGETGNESSSSPKGRDETQDREALIVELTLVYLAAPEMHHRPVIRSLQLGIRVYLTSILFDVIERRRTLQTILGLFTYTKGAQMQQRTHTEENRQTYGIPVRLFTFLCFRPLMNSSHYS